MTTKEDMIRDGIEKLQRMLPEEEPKEEPKEKPKKKEKK